MRPQHRPGRFAWVELATPDPEASARFYGELFGWKLAAPDGTMAFATLDGARVAGVRELGATEHELGVPAHWSAHLAVDDVDAVARHAAELGGTLFVRPYDDALARRAVIQDPAGAFVGVWHGRGLAGVERAGEPGALAWCELYARSPELAADFYTGLVGWTVRAASATGPRMWFFEQAGTPVATLMQIQPSWGPMPVAWQVYFAVAGCDRAVEIATRLGARVIVPPTSPSPATRFATLFDPQGAAFALLEGGS